MFQILLEQQMHIPGFDYKGKVSIVTVVLVQRGVSNGNHVMLDSMPIPK